MSDVLTSRDVNEIADTPAGSVQPPVNLALDRGKDDSSASLTAPTSAADVPARLSVASIGQDGNVKFEATDDFKAFAR